MTVYSPEYQPFFTQFYNPHERVRYRYIEPSHVDSLQKANESIQMLISITLLAMACLFLGVTDKRKELPGWLFTPASLTPTTWVVIGVASAICIGSIVYEIVQKRRAQH